MRAIANGQLEGFPPKEELRTVYVEHDIDASQAETPVVEFVYSDPNLQGVDRFTRYRVGLSSGRLMFTTCVVAFICSDQRGTSAYLCA